MLFLFALPLAAVSACKANVSRLDSHAVLRTAMQNHATRHCFGIFTTSRTTFWPLLTLATMYMLKL